VAREPRTQRFVARRHRVALPVGEVLENRGPWFVRLGSPEPGREARAIREDDPLVRRPSDAERELHYEVNIAGIHTLSEHGVSPTVARGLRRSCRRLPRIGRFPYRDERCA
jgi:hypothetical protein